MKKRIVSMLLVLALCLAALPAVALADGGNPTTEEDLKIAVAAGGTVTLGGDITLTETLEISGTVKLCLGGHVLSLAPAEEGKGNGRVIHIEKTGELTLTDSYSTLKYKFTVNDDGLWVLDGSITDETGTDETGTKIVSGGIITGGVSGSDKPDGGGVYNEGTFNMGGGTIVGNSSYNGGGVKNEGTFEMASGAIVGNTAVLSSDNLGGYGGGVYNHTDGTSTASFTMIHGDITDNTAATSGGGIHSSGISSKQAALTMGADSSPRNILRNRAENGGGIYADNTTVFFEVAPTISDNTATNCGGGVFIKNGSFTMRSAEISGNNAEGNGGGMYCGSDCTVTMLDGSITGNNAEGNGGGVYCGGDCTVIMTDGKISGNNAEGNGGGMYCGVDSFTVSEGVTVTDNVRGGTQATDGTYYGGEDSNVYLPTGKTIAVSGSFYGTLGVTTEQTVAYPDTIAIAIGTMSTFADKFTSDNDLYNVQRIQTVYDGYNPYVIQFVGKCTHEGTTRQDDGTYKCPTCKEIMAASLTVGDTTTYYASLADALVAAQKVSGTPVVKVLKALTGESEAKSSGSFTLDLNGHSVEFAEGKSLEISGGSMTITNSGTDTTAKISTVSTQGGTVVTVSGDTVGSLSGKGTAIVGTPGALTAAARGGVANIKLADNITMSDPLNIISTGTDTDIVTVTLDLNGHTLTANVTVGEIAEEGKEGTTTSGKSGYLNIQDSSASGTGVLTSSSGTTLAIAVGTVRLRSGKVSSGGGDGACAIQVGTGAPACGLYADGGEVDGDVIVSDGTSAAPKKIYTSSGTGTVFNGEVTVGSNAELKGGTFNGTVTINGGGKVDNASGTIINNGAFVFENGSNIIIGSDTINPSSESPTPSTIQDMDLSGSGYVQVKGSDTSSDPANYTNSGTKIQDIDTKKTVTFDLNGGKGTIPQQGLYDNNKKATEPATKPTRDGYTFGGWYTDKDCTEESKYDFSTVVSKDITLYAKWELDTGGGGEEETEPPFAGFLPSILPGVIEGAAGMLDATFADVPHGAYYYNAVEWAYSKGIAGGVDSKHFAPDESCTRAQAVTMLYRAAGCPDIWGENPFVDVSADDYYYKAVLWAVANGITSGTDATHFSPDEPCTRGQIVTFLHRAARCYVAHESFGYTDVKPGSYCEDAINWAVETGITNGTGEATFSPDSVCTRAQIVTFLYRNR